MSETDSAKHVFEQVGELHYGYCGHEYCGNSRCRSWAVMPDGSTKFDVIQRCSCGEFEYSGKKDKQKELEHVLKAEGLYA